MIFESDEIKANINKQTHDVTFAEAEEVFDDVNKVEFFSEKEMYNEYNR